MTPRWLWEHDEYAAYLGECECKRCCWVSETIEEGDEERCEDLEWSGVDNL